MVMREKLVTTGTNGVPKSRLIVGATKGLTTALGEMISALLSLSHV